ncbi:SLAM family member 7 isoform X2 [Grammomys surdaster]|uniref:SLAM family member 7 isoform X2 n=1 Tax=Grammomys surdaster TaxID=491861 RepID=UPI00109F3030|nr:SLAM family member 7 isoform X2 [Grammomys surdaster]
MAGFSTCIIFTCVLCQLTVTAASGTLKEVAGALDGSVTFTLNITEIKVDYVVVWTFKTLFLAIVDKNNGVISQSSNKERMVFPDGHSMKLSQLRKNDSGAYRAEIHSSSLQSPFTQEYVLHVYEYLPRPKVTMNRQSNKNGTCIINLTCSVEQNGENVTYSWKAMGQAVNEFHDSANLPISWRLGEKDKTLICMARNPVSNSSSTPILVQKLCEGAATDLNSPRGILYILCISVVLILFSVSLAIILHIKWAQKRKEKETRRRGTKHILFHCADSQSGEESQLPACNACSACSATHSNAIKL